MANPSDFVRYSIYSKRDPDSGDYHIPSYDKDRRNIINNALKSSLPEGAFFYVGEKQLSKQGQERIDIYIHKEHSNVAGKSLATMEEELKFKGGEEKYHITRARPVTEEQAKMLSKEEKEREKANADSETSRFNKGAFIKIIAILTAVADITRRILSSIMSFSQRTVQDMVTAHNLGMSYEAVRSYRHIETAHGMKEGTITGAVADIQAKFGNITALDEKALEALAVVMGGKIEDMAKMGLGASNPEAVLGAILDAFNEKANAGYNSVGQYVGEAQARRELYSYLLKVSPQVADIFATMQEEQHNINSIYRNQADTFEKFKNLNITKRGGNDELNYGVTVTLGQEWNQLLDTVNQIKEAFVLAFAPALLSLMRRLADTRIGMTETEKRQRNEENKEKNKQAYETTKKTMEYYEKQGLDKLKPEDKAYYLALKDYAEELEKENKRNTVNNLVKTYAEVKLEGMKYLPSVNAQAHDKALMTLGFSDSLNDATDDEIADTIEAYNYDTPEMQAKFKEYKTNQNIKIAKAVEKLDEDARKEEYRESKREADTKIKQSLKDKNNIMTSTRKRVPMSQRRNFDLLMEAYETFHLPYDLSSAEWTTGNAEAMVFKELKRLSDAGHVIKDNKTGIYQGLSDVNYKQSQESKDKIRDMFSPVTDDDYNYWLYEQNKDAMDDSILAQRADEERQRYKQARVADNLNILYDSEGTLNDWKARVAKALSAGGTADLYAVNDSSNGENYLRFILEINDNGKVTKKEVYAIAGVTGEAGFMGTATYDKETKQVTLDPTSTGTSASEGI